MMNILKLILKASLSLVLIAGIFQYILNDKYIFQETQPFVGNHFYNPYEKMDSTKWKRANFHAHTSAWIGLTNGRNNTEEAIDSIYTYLDYDIFNISNYQKINTFESRKETYIPEFEHGFLPPKNHQLVINAKEVKWKDFLLPQTLDNKQSVINSLKENNNILVIAHPRLRNAYQPSDFRYLSNYDLIEILNQNRFSVAHWDSALSTGHAIFALGDDDVHDISDIYQVGRCCTFINTMIKKDSILHALKTGNAFVADVYMADNEPYFVKKQIMNHLPVLQEVSIYDSTITVRVNQQSAHIDFYGQGGKLLQQTKTVFGASYHIKSIDPYVRTKITFPDSTSYYLNPVIRYDGKSIPQYGAKYDPARTLWWRICGIAGIGVLVYFYTRRKK